MAGGLVDQVVGTALLMVGVFAISDQTNVGVPGWLGPVLVGVLVVAIGVAFGFNAGYAINPARDFGPRLFTAVAGWGAGVFIGRRRLVVGADRRPDGRRGARRRGLRRVHHPAAPGGGRADEPLRARARSGHDVEPGDPLRSRRARRVAARSRSYRQIFPQPGHVEHDPEDIWRSQLATAREALARAGSRRPTSPPSA